jgi:hypothetical protein
MVRLGLKDQAKNEVMVFERHACAVMAYKVDHPKLLLRAVRRPSMLAESVRKSSGHQSAWKGQGVLCAVSLWQGRPP